MSNSSQSRREIGIYVAVGLGLLIGFFIKKVHIGLMIGLFLGLVGGGMLSGGKKE